MKRALFVILSVCVFIMSFLIGCAPGNTPVETPQEVSQDASDNLQIAGGFTEWREPDAEEITLFESVMENNTDGTILYTPESVQTQVVAGLNYSFVAIAEPQDGSAPYEVYVLIYQPLTGDPELTDITLPDGTSVK